MRIKIILFTSIFLVFQNKILKASVPPPSSPVYHLQSFPGAEKVIYLDFDGQVVNSVSWKNNNTNNPGKPINAQPANVNENDILTIWKTVREDYIPFQVNVTTDSTIFKQAAFGKRQMCIFTPTYEWNGQFGISLLGSFNYDEPCFAFTVFNKGKAVAEVASHELGHTFGLNHDGINTPFSDYYNGHGTYPKTWSPIMGGAHSKTMTQWSKGEYQNANNTEDDLAKLASILGYRVDETGSTFDASIPLLLQDTSGTLKGSMNTGVITTRSDIDVYSFTTTGGEVLLQVNGAANTMNSTGDFTCIGNLDILLELKDGLGNIYATSDDQNSNSGNIRASLTAGTYYLFIDGTGYLNPLNDGYSDYGSIGEYSISGSIPFGINQAPVVQLIDNGYFHTPNIDNYFAARTTGPMFEASVADLDGTIAKVEFYNGNILLSTDASAPYEYNFFFPSLAGIYSIYAKAYDNTGKTGISEAVTVQVFEPKVTIISKPSLNNYVEGENITIQAFAEVHYSRSINDVKFYDGTSLLATFTSTQIPYTYILTNVGAGVHNIKVVASMSYYTHLTGESTITLSVAPKQPGDFIVSTQSICKGSSGISFEVPFVNGITYNWTYDGSGMTIQAGEDSNSIVASFGAQATSGTLSVMAIKNGVTSIVRSIPITINDVPQQPIEILGSANPKAASIDNIYSIVAVDGIAYSWTYKGTGGTILRAGNKIDLDLSANATSGDLEVIAVNLCGSSNPTILTLTIIPAGVTAIDNLHDTNFEISPNPSSGKFKLEIPSFSTVTNIQICNSLGEVIYENRLPLEGVIDLPNVIPGSYIISIRNDRQIILKKLVIQ